MHVLQPKHIKLKEEEVDKLLKKINISLSQLPKIAKNDAGLPENIEVGDVFRIERKTKQGEEEYFRVVV
jgi:DNA-directed RNA polymerase subunit H (RpoH/RPB5)